MKKYKKWIIFLIVSCLLAIFFYWQNHDIVVSHHEYILDEKDKELDGYKVLQISDLHNKTFGKNHKYLLAVIEKEKPDMIVLTGDLVDSSHTDVDAALSFVEEAVKLAPAYYITGNHEVWMDEEKYIRLKEGLLARGIKILDDEMIWIPVKESGFYLLGLDDISIRTNALQALMEAGTEKRTEALTILLAHEPQYINHYAEEGVDIVFSGHAHGGQFRIPFIGGLYAPGQGFLPQYTAGVHMEGETTMYISRGLGNSVFPIRIFNRPEVVVVTLSAEK